MPYDGFIIVGKVRRGGRLNRVAAWDGRAWSPKRAMVYPSRSAAGYVARRVPDHWIFDKVQIIKATQ